MNCPGCGHENRDAARFCEQCGQPVAASCLSCANELRPGSRFCDGCGTAVAEGAAPARGSDRERERLPLDYTPRHLAEKILKSRSAIEGERKQVTVLFADVKSSMELAEGLDPEEWHRILDRFFGFLTDGIHRFEGTVNQYTGDGIMALFGAPIAHEDHAQRACYAALYLRGELGRHTREVKREHGLGFSVRMGLHSGEVVVGRIGDDLRMDYTAQGHTVGLASRMQELAAPDTCYLTGQTAARVQGYFELEDLGPFNVRGVSEPVPVFELRKLGQARTRFDISKARGLTRFVGRGDEVHTLETALVQARAGDGQVVGLVADAGVGKSRLSFEFLEACRARGMRTLEGRAVPHGKNIPLLPILQAFRDYFEISEQDGERRIREKIAGRMLLFDEEYRDDLPLMFEFFGVPDPKRPAPRMDPAARQRQLFRVLRHSVQRDNSEGTIITLIEDLHWLDGASEAWLAEWVDAHAGSQNLLLVNTRPEYSAAWMQRPWYRQIPLRPLGPAAIRDLLSDLLGEAASSDALVSLIHERTAGNPFFAEEIVRGLVESGHLEGERRAYRLATPVERIQVPESVQSLLAARIDKLAERDKQLLQTAAVLGREFSEPVLAAVSEFSPEELTQTLQRLRAADFIYEESPYPVVEYAFKHPLTQEVALHSQLREQRRAIHERAAKAFELARADHLDEAAGLIAHHWEEAGRSLLAAQWHARAGVFIGTSDFVASLRHCERARVLLREVTDAPEAPELGATACRQVLALALRLGIDDAERDVVYQEGMVWAARCSSPHFEGRLHQAVSVAESSSTCRSEVALEYAKGWERIARELPDGAHSSTALWPTIQPLLQLGEFERARENLRWQIEATEGHPDWGLLDWGISAHASAIHALGQTEAYCGELGEARALLERATEVARAVGDTETETWASSAMAEVAIMAGDAGIGRIGAQRGVELSERMGSPYSRAISHPCLAWMLWLDGQLQEALESFEYARDEITRTQTGTAELARIDAGLSLTQLALGDAEQALELAEAGSERARRHGFRAHGLYTALAHCRALRALGADPASIAPVLDDADAALAVTGAVNFAPLLRVERAELAGLRGERAERKRLLEAALTRFEAIGATGHAARVTGWLG